MVIEGSRWKERWELARAHFVQWWDHTGPVLVVTGLRALDRPRDDAPMPDHPPNPRARNTDPVWFASNERARLARQALPADTLPIAHVDYGCVQLAACFGAEPHFAEDTVWYHECIDEPDTFPPLRLTKTEKWWQVYKAILMEVVRASQGDFLIGAPAFGSNLDVLAELRGTQLLLCDLVERPGWVKEKLEEINAAFFIAFDDYYEQIKLADGSSAYAYFHLWGLGKTSQVQCDFAAMISPDMYREFVIPPLQRQCAWLDHSLFHLDGPNCISHLDHLLAIEELDAVQWTPGAGQPGAGDPKWYELYRRILNAGKSVQILGVSPDEARQILDTFGGAGVYLSVQGPTGQELEALLDLVESLRARPQGVARYTC
ncbi:MAG: hypothetical protein HY706_22595 [Candidatus Hydrogenedentes bacterium]|nr:hypothetical protein [Candidatus Hydrogenedentota bacterium]